MNLDHTQSPTDLVMPATAQLVTTVIYGIGAFGFIILAVILAKREKTILPILYVLGALLTLFLEPVVDLLGNAVHPQIGQYNIITTNGHMVPWAVFVGYVWYFAALPLLAYKQIKERSLTSGFIWKTFALIAISAAIVEQVPLHFGTWIYYGYQPFKIGYMPVWWIFANTAAVIVPFLILYKLYPVLNGWRRSLVIPIIPMGAFMGHSAAGWPMYNALGLETETASTALIQSASIASIILSCLVVWIVMKMADV